MTLRTGISISGPFSSGDQATAGIIELRRSQGSTHTVCSKQLFYSLILFLPFSRDPARLSVFSGEANLANRLQQLPLKSHGGTMTIKINLSSSRSKDEFLILHSKHSEVFWPRWACFAPVSSLNLALWLQTGKKQASAIGKKTWKLSPSPCHIPPWLSPKWHYWELHQIYGYWNADVTVFHCVRTKMTAFPCLFCT